LLFLKVTQLGKGVHMTMIHERPNIFQFAIAIMLSVVVSLPLARAQDRTETTTVGGPGGGDFSFDCPRNTYLSGLRARYGAWIDAVAAECSPYNTSTQRLEAGKVSRDFGGKGGGEGAMRCARPRGVIVGLQIFQANNGDQSLGHIIIDCGDLFNPETFANKAAGGAPYLGQSIRPPRLTVSCPPNYVATGIRGKYGAYVDRLGLICSKKPFTLGLPKRAEIAGRKGHW
jgi:hypothetical protein